MPVIRYKYFLNIFENYPVYMNLHNVTRNNEKLIIQ